ncbi:MAG: hypothetical protein ACLP5H_03915 [Desulfomonilaceae bacterium]
MGKPWRLSFVLPSKPISIALRSEAQSEKMIVRDEKVCDKVQDSAVVAGGFGLLTQQDLSVAGDMRLHS